MILFDKPTSTISFKNRSKPMKNEAVEALSVIPIEKTKRRRAFRDPDPRIETLGILSRSKPPNFEGDRNRRAKSKP